MEIFLFIYDIQHCFICHPSDSTVSGLITAALSYVPPYSAASSECIRLLSFPTALPTLLLSLSALHTLLLPLNALLLLSFPTALPTLLLSLTALLTLLQGVSVHLFILKVSKMFFTQFCAHLLWTIMICGIFTIHN